MKALTLWQPWASLIAEGVKTIETRSWSTGYRGPLAIHAAARPPGRYDEAGDACWCALGREASVRYEATRYGLYDLTRPPLPLGAVVATCTLTDVVPITTERGYGAHVLVDHGPLHVVGEAYQHYTTAGDVDVTQDGWSAETQRPYGDFTPGRYAWLLANIVRLDLPVPARGRQGLWEWAS